MDYAKVVNGLKAYKNKPPFLSKKWNLKSDKTYIIPTGFGFSFAALSFVLLVLSIGFANNLIYFFTFLLISMALAGMWLTNSNVDSATFIDIQADYLFAGEKNTIKVLLINKNSSHSIWDSYLQIDPKNNSEISIEKVTEIQNLEKVLLLWTPPKRGYVEWPRLILQSRFPFKMLKAWKYFSKKGAILIYPQRTGRLEIPDEKGEISMTGDAEKSQNPELFREFLPFQKTDSPLRIDWKKSLKHQRHFVKNFESSQQKKIVIDWKSVDFLITFEEKISQLTLWIDICEKKKDFYSLRIKSFQTEFGRDTEHYRHCLEKLALLKESEIV